MSDFDQSDPKQSAERLEKLLRGAFAKPPTQLKAIPKKRGESHVPAAKKTKIRKRPA